VRASLHQASRRLRHFSTRDLNELGREHLFMVADAAHNIPDALAGNACHRANLERDVLALEAMLVEPYDIAIGRYLVREESRCRSSRAFVRHWILTSHTVR
jgi:hypothetical protein